jgi:hypothetical protein
VFCGVDLCTGVCVCCTVHCVQLHPLFRDYVEKCVQRDGDCVEK